MQETGGGEESRPPPSSFDEDDCPMSRTLGAEPAGETSGQEKQRERERERDRVCTKEERARRVKFIHKKENYYARGEATPAK